MAGKLVDRLAEKAAQTALLAAAASAAVAVVRGLAGGGRAVRGRGRTVAVPAAVVALALASEVAEGALEVFLGRYSVVS